MNSQGIEKIHVDHFDDAILENLARLAETTYPGREISSSDYLRWEYLDNPNGNAIGSVAVDTPLSNPNKINIISQYIVVPRTYLINGETVQGSLSVNTLTHPDYRRRGLFADLASQTFQKCAENGVRFTIGFPNSKSHPIIKDRNIFMTLGYLPLLIKAFNPINSFMRYLTSGSDKSGSEIELVDENKSGDVSHLDLEADIKYYEEFLGIVNSEKENMTLRSAEFMKWRYVDIPHRKYRLLKLYSDDKIHAMAVIRARKIFGIRCGILVDFVSSANSKNDPRLLKYIDEIARKNNLDMMIATVPIQSVESGMISKNGYFSLPQFILPQKLAFILRKHLDCPATIADFKRWFITFGDYDIF